MREGLQHPSGRRILKWEVTFFVCSMYNTKAVLIAMLITAIVAIVVTIFCFQTKARRGMHPALPSLGQVWGAGQWGHPRLSCDICVSPIRLILHRVRGCSACWALWSW